MRSLTQLRLPSGREATLKPRGSRANPLRRCGNRAEHIRRPRGHSQPRLRVSNRAPHRYRRGFGQRQLDEDRAAPQLRPGSGEALCDAFAGALPFVAACCDAQRPRSPHDTPQMQRSGPSGFHANLGLARLGRRTQTQLADLSELVALPRKYTSPRTKSTRSSTTASLCSVAPEVAPKIGRPNARCACTACVLFEYRKTSRSYSVVHFRIST